jgi:hypothetical protein
VPGAGVYSLDCHDVKVPDWQVAAGVGEGKLASGSVTTLAPVDGGTLVFPLLSW